MFYLQRAQGFKLGSSSGHMHRTLVPSHEGHIKFPCSSTGTQAEYHCRLPLRGLPPPRLLRPQGTWHHPTFRAYYKVG